MGTVGTGEVAGAGAITTAGGGGGGGTRGRVIARRVDGLEAPPGLKPFSTAGGAVLMAAVVRRRVRVEMRPGGGKTVTGAALPGGDRPFSTIQSSTIT